MCPRPGSFTVRRALPWPPNKHFLQVSQSRYANLIDRHASIKSFNTQLPNENLSILTDKVEAKAQQLYKTWKIAFGVTVARLRKYLFELAADINETPSAMAIFDLFYR